MTRHRPKINKRDGERQEQRRAHALERMAPVADHLTPSQRTLVERRRARLILAARGKQTEANHAR